MSVVLASMSMDDPLVYMDTTLISMDESWISMYIYGLSMDDPKISIDLSIMCFFIFQFLTEVVDK